MIRKRNTNIVITREQIINIWGEDNTYLIKNNNLEKLQLSSNTKEFVSIIGFPKQPSLWINFEVENSFITLEKYLEKYNKPYIENSDKYYLIGHKGYTDDMYVCLKIKDETIWIIEETKQIDISDNFVNSSLQLLVEFLYFYEKYDSEINDPELKVETMKDKFLELDSKALKNENSFWSIILEETEEGII